MRTFNSDGSIRLNSDGSWHKDILLEDVGIVTGTLNVDHSPASGLAGLIAAQLVRADLMIATGAFNADGSKHLMPGSGAWSTGLIFIDLLAPNNDTLDGGDDDDVLIGQRGDDSLAGGRGNDLLIADNASNTLPFETDTPNILSGIRLLEIAGGAGVDFTLPDGGNVIATMGTIYPQEFGFSAPDYPLTGDPVPTLRDLVSQNIPRTDGTTLTPYVTFVPNVLNTDALPGNDSINGGDGDDLIFGDNAQFLSPIVTGLDAVDTAMR